MSFRIPSLARFIPPAILVILLPTSAFAADMNGAELSIIWAIPFVGMLLSIALFPLLAHRFWEHNMGLVAGFWGLLVLVPMALVFGIPTAWSALVHAALLEYVPFILLLLALFTVAGGIVIRGNLHGSPAVNSLLLAIGAVLASIIGTTGAAMVMIRPVIRANDDRKHNAHVIIFFIFLVANIGGSLTPLGDPPLFLGFLKGVDFFWTTTHLLPETGLVSIILLALFYLMDSALYKKEGRIKPDPTPDSSISISGGWNFLLIAVIICSILGSAAFDLGTVTIAGNTVEIANLTRDIIMVAVAVTSFMVTPKADREANDFNWGPILEVAKLFAGIFIAIIPVIAILKAGMDGAMSPLVALVSKADGGANNVAYFWLTGFLSAFLDNAPTYLVFFEMAGGNAETLMTTGARTLAAISSGAVFMGALTYIGNAPNFMVYAIARSSGVKMPNFFTYMMWSFSILLPVFMIVTLVFFW
jgi:Na+/H+ antiporter NhaD and related arsenite permeases